jgi:uncharacterized protein YcgL (UPF0745 family)
VSAATQRIVQVFRSRRREDTYLIVDRAEGLARVPEPLLAHFGPAEPSFTFVLTPERRLARAEPGAVLEALEAQGFYLQLPPPEAEERGEAGS